ncbi:MAG: IreB family regulatory phosphoprotein [Bacillota bacterium]|nr:IreB family regulatory phosphoprotein [Bacillota bacterium]
MKETLDRTQWFEVEEGHRAASVLRLVYRALEEKGYNPVSQLVGYLLSGDPTYITNHLNARTAIGDVDRDELLEELVRHYLVGQQGV